MNALDLTGADLVRALGGILARPAVDRALRTRGERLAETLADDAMKAGIEEPEVRVVRREAGAYAVTVSAPGLFAREFGSLNRPADPLIGAAVARIAGKG